MVKPFLTDSYLRQTATWPSEGRHILAQYDETSIVVYQAYRPAIADFAVTHQRFGGQFSLTRMSWIKPNFLWMMYRCGWAKKADQERVLAVRILRSGFDEILRQAVASSFDPAHHATAEEWQLALKRSAVRLQWDPDHDPAGKPLARRAIQLGLREDVLRQYAHDWIVEIRDITPFAHAGVQQSREQLIVAAESVYLPADRDVAVRLGLTPRTP